ncbi:hypothetical protein PB1_02835 [Bacillus methanolicus PB1]|uniref:Uncharacterized protein n=1 Tax=Bacillus methanolicus PB1 TaxID=997296 RepID=I3E5R9_BACMT|nr:hypothetical protein PB1_02835 [Bacillus methanolicus PB1]
MKKTMQQLVAWSFSYIKYEPKGMGEIFHGQTKGYLFAYDQLHICNIT